ncbi:16S rRNA (adenine(1518)-N(6)/adenine(1519)-N(6))-dimethyltransferase RsmA [Breznakiella homolactica]|uniref:Ribosomal RNA small subunit methyltransferase A n=2 Tax=Breznakiella homolactica TaxID=2798577 RepID=A0A7T7XRX7_9SPIR|nr:16S rRNA (adenine(1518)-N(6)/adenine(1519)-N(6))-dimethyltransferase RsmA [Breznakiella homolactica]
MQKKFGQNFLINPNARKRLIDELGIAPGDAVWEIGPGLGAMTRELLDRGATVTAFEIDQGFVSSLKEIFDGSESLRIVPGDALKTWKKESVRAKFLFGNLPYNVGSVILGDFIESKCFFSRVVVTVQREVARRMAAEPGSKDYSSFSVLCSSVYRVSPLLVLKGSSFFPPPHVDSQGVRLDLRDDIDPAGYPVLFTPLVRGLFASRRKTVKNNLQMFLSNRRIKDGIHIQDAAESALEVSGIDPRERAENLGIGEFRTLAAALEVYVG